MNDAERTDHFTSKAERYAAAGITVLEVDDGTVLAEVSSHAGAVKIVASLVWFEDALVLDTVHVTGKGLTIARIRQLAKSICEIEDVSEVIMQGGKRMSGRMKGRLPTLIRVERRS